MKNKFVVVVLVALFIAILFLGIQASSAKKMHTYQITKIGGQVVVEDFHECIPGENMELWCYGDEWTVMFRAVDWKIIK